MISWYRCLAARCGGLARGLSAGGNGCELATTYAPGPAAFSSASMMSRLNSSSPSSSGAYMTFLLQWWGASSTSQATGAEFAEVEDTADRGIGEVAHEQYP